MFTGEIRLKKKRIPSVNQAHKIGRNRFKVWIYLNPTISDFISEVTHTLRKQKIHEYFADKKENFVVELQIIYVLKNRFWKRDVTNLTKYLEDGIVKASGIDDSLHTKVNVRKIENDIDDEEYIIIVMEEKKLDEYSYKLSDWKR